MKTKMLTGLMGWCVLAAGTLAGVARAQLPILVQQDFEAYPLGLGPGNAVITNADGWVRFKAATTTNNVPDGLHPNTGKVGNITASATAELRYWCSPAITGHVGILTFDASIYRVSETNAPINLVVFLADTNNKPTGYTPYTNIVLTATNTWTSHTVAFNQYGVTNKYLVLGRNQADHNTYRLQLDQIVLRAAPSSMTPTNLELPGGVTTWFSNQALSPVLSVNSVGTVTAPVATLWYRYSGAAWSSVAMVASGSTYVLAAPIPASGVSNRQFEMYAVLEYTDELGPQSFSYPASGAADPLRIDILPVSGNDSMMVQGALAAELALISNQVWRGGMEREAGVTNVATYWFAGPSNTWGSASAPSIPFQAPPTAGQTLPAPADARARDVIFSFDETTPTEMSVQYGKYQSFENWGVTSAHGWSLGVGAVLTNSAPSVLPGSSSLAVAGGAGAYLQSPAQAGIRSVGLWFRRLSTGTNAVTVTVQKQVGASWTNVVTFAGLPSDLFAYRSVTLNDATATAIRIYADAPALLDNVAVTDLSRATLANPVVIPDPVVATLPADLTVQVVTTNGAAIVSSGVVLHYRYATSGGFTDVTLVPTNGLYRTRDSARIAAAPDASQNLQYYVTAQYSTWDNVPMPLAYTTTNTVPVVPYSAWGIGGLRVVGALNAQMNLASNRLWHGAVLVTNAVVAPSFRFQDSTNGWWGSASPKMQPAAGTATNGVQFAFTNTVSSSLAFSFNEANREYLIQSADFEPFTNGVLRVGWDATNVDFTASSAGVQGQGALTTNSNAVVLSPVRAGVGDVGFWACMANPSASSSYTVQKRSAGGTWEPVGASGTISGGFYRYYRVGAGDPVATQARVLFGSAGVLVDEIVVTAAGAYVALSSPTISTNSTPYTPMSAATNVVPVVGYGRRPILGITAAAQNGAGSIAVRVAYTSDSNPAETNELALIGSPAGGVFTNAMPALAVGTNRYWYTATYSGMSASPVRYPETGYYRYATDGTLGVDRNPNPVAWAAVLGGGFIDNWDIDGWNLNGVYLLDGAVQFDDADGERRIRSPGLNGIGTVYFKAKPTLTHDEIHKIVVEVASTSNGPWTMMQEVTVPVSLNYTSFRVVLNNYGNPRYVQIRRTTIPADNRNRLAIKDIVITPPPADVTIVEPSIITPGYPSEISPITFLAQVAMKAGSTNYPASSFEPTLVWRWGSSGAWVYSAMTNTAVSGRYAMTLAPMSPGIVEYYYRVAFSGPSYTYVDSTTVPATVYDEGRSPAYLGWDGSAFTNSVQLCRQIPTARQFRVRMFESNHSTVELRRYDTQENTEMVLVGDHTWQGLLYLTNAVNMELTFAGTNTYVNGATAYGAVQSWGDTNQVTINPPLSGHASLGATNIVIQMNHLGFVMFRLNVTNGLYEVRRAAFQDFNTWQASDVYFEESFGLHDIKEYATDFEGVPATVPVSYMYDFDDETADVLSRPHPPYAVPKNVLGWRLENAWVIQERVSTTNTTATLPPANKAIRINAGAGTLQSTSLPNGRDALTFNHRVSFGDENTPYHRNGFTWTNYTVRANATVSEASPGNPTLSLIGYYYDRDNFYELQLTQEREHPASNATDRVVGRVYHKRDGAYELLGATAFTTNKVALLGKTWNLGMTLATTGSSSVQISVYAGVVGGLTNTSTVITDSSPGVLISGGSVSFNVHDTVALFSLLEVVPVGGTTPYPGFVNTSASNWYLGGTPLGTSPPQPTRWVWGSGGTLTRPRPSAPFDVQIIQVGDALVLPNPPTWMPKSSGTSTSLSYSTVTIPIRTWDHTFARIVPRLSDGMLMVDDLSTRDWRGVTVTDPTPLPSNDPNGLTVWRGEQAYLTSFAGNKKIELTRSRANPASVQMLVSPVLGNGIGTIAFTYQSTGGTSHFIVERNTNDAQYEDDDFWSPVSEVVAPAGTATNLYATIRLNMVGRVRVRMEDDSDPTASLWLDDFFVTDYPLTDASSWEAYNALITPLQPDKTFEPDYPTYRTSYLNNSPTLDVRENIVYGEDKPYIQSPAITNGIGEIGFWFRTWNPTAEYPGKLKLMMADSPTSTNWVEVTLLDDPVADAAYKARLSNITNSAYEYFMIEISDTENKVLRIYSETNNADRVALDQIIVTEPVRSSIDILAVTMYPDIPLADDPVGVNVWLGNPRMDPYDIRVFLDYCLEGTNVWGVENWGSDPQLYERVELQQSPTNQFLYSTTPFTMIPPQPLDAVVQYRVVVTYKGKAPKPVEFTSFTNPDWYFPIDLNATFEGVGFSPYYFVFSCSTGTVFFNEFFYAFNAAYYNREYIEIIGPRNVSIANWRVDVVDAAFSATEDFVRTSYTLPDPSYLHGGTNGWGFYVLGDTDATISNRVDYYLPDGGNPLQSPVTVARLPINGGFRLVRGMGAYVDRISYGTSSIPQEEMVARGYTFTAIRGTFGSAPNRAIGLLPDTSGTNLTWQLVALGLETLGDMNPQEEEVLPIIGSDDVLQAALTLVITEIQVASGAAIVRANAASTNTVSDFTGWTGVLQTNALLELGEPGWGNTTSSVSFGTATNYTFGVALPVEAMLFRIKASNPIAP